VSPFRSTSLLEIHDIMKHDEFRKMEVRWILLRKWHYVGTKKTRCNKATWLLPPDIQRLVVIRMTKYQQAPCNNHISIIQPRRERDATTSGLRT